MPAVVVFVWLPALLWLDRTASLAEQRVLGLITWLLLLLLLRRETPLVRMQTVVVIVFATAVEYTFAGWLGVYVYRLENVPWFVPPGHGMVYLGALALGRSTYVRTHLRGLMVAVAVVVARTRCGGCRPSRRGSMCLARSGTPACSASCSSVAHVPCTSGPSSW